MIITDVIAVTNHTWMDNDPQIYAIYRWQMKTKTIILCPRIKISHIHRWHRSLYQSSKTNE
jgi:hypothetical protein